MKFKNIVCLITTFAAMALMAVGVQAATYYVETVSTTAGSTIDLPVKVDPGAGSTASVNGYAVAYTYNNTLVTPQPLTAEAGTSSKIYDDESVYAAVGSLFDDENAVIVSDTKDNGDGTSTLIIAWASAQPITVDSAAELSKVSFEVASTATGSIPITVTSATVLEDASVGEPQTVEAVSGEIDLGTVIARGDADGNGAISISDAATVAQYLLGKATIYSDYAADADGNGTVNISDAATIAQYLVSKAIIP